MEIFLRILFLNFDHHFDLVTACYVLVVILKGIIKDGFVGNIIPDIQSSSVIIIM